tara:strand:- start:358 stop:729 length:372 start_codon:yes stop_codon:yes gene_type:complete
MKIIKENALLVSLLVFISLLSAHAKAQAQDWQSELYNFRWMHVPVVCGPSEEVQRYLKDNNFELDSVSIGREGAKKDGDPAYWVSYFVNEDRTESVSAITSPTGNETCMMYRSFDLKKPGTQT